ncbi:UNVERIFIED_CONTAM: hypothetical protein FKN15_059381 [Acipenser sinensis]
MNTRCPPKRVPSAVRFFTFCRLIRTTASEDNAALGNLQANPQALGQTTGVAGARRPIRSWELQREASPDLNAQEHQHSEHRTWTRAHSLETCCL